MAKDAATKVKRGPLTSEEIDEMVEKYRADTHSLSDLSREYNSNPTTISRALRDRGVKFRPPGPTEFQRQKQIKLYALRKEQARAYETYAENIKKTEARIRREERAARKAAEAEEQYQAWVNAPPVVETADGHLQEDTVDEDVRTETTWSGGAQGDVHGFNEVLGQVEDLVRPVESFHVTMPEGSLRWTRAGENPVLAIPEEQERAMAAQQRDDDYSPAAMDRTVEEDEPAMTEMSQQSMLCFAGKHDRCTAEWCACSCHAEEQVRQLIETQAAIDQALADGQQQHAAEKLRWESGVAFGYDQATNHIANLVTDLLTDPREFGTANTFTQAALHRVLQLLDEGEHFYRARRNPKPWNDAQSWSS